MSLLEIDEEEPALVLSEDRHSGISHHFGFPWYSLQEAVKVAGAGNIVAVGYSRDKECFRTPPPEYFEGLLDDEQEAIIRPRLGRLFLRLEKTSPEFGYLPGEAEALVSDMRLDAERAGHLRKRLNYLLVKFTNELFTEKQISTFLPGVPVEGLNHHETHAAAYFASSYDHAAVITWDGRGEFDTTVLWEGRGGSLTRVAAVRHPLSLGAFYEIFSEYVGFNRISGPGKMMGLAAYGKPRYQEIFSRLIRVDKDGFGFDFDPRYLSCTQSERVAVTPALAELIGPPRRGEDPIEERHKDIAFAAQKALEDACIRLVDHAKKRLGTSRFVLSGGLSLNCVMNEKLRAACGVELFMLPPCGDDGTSLGAAILLRNRVRKEEGLADKRIRYATTYGLSNDAAQARRYCEENGLKVRAAGAADLAALLQADKTVGLMIGRYEFGPRALCFRSILANPAYFANWDRINHQIKYREDFRPFAPVLLREDAEAFWGSESRPTDAPYMLLAPILNAKAKAAIPAVVHMDGTARLQTLDRAFNPFMHELLVEFKKLCGVGCLMNTSLNMAGESIIVDYPDLLAFLAASNLDAVFIDGLLVEKKDNKEALARLGSRFAGRPEYLTGRKRRYQEFLDRNRFVTRYQNFEEFYRFLFPNAAKVGA